MGFMGENSMGLVKQRYYVKCGELETWVEAYDHINAASKAMENAKGGITLDPYFFYVCRDYVPKIETTVGSVIACNLEAENGVCIVPTDDVIEDEIYE